MKSLQCNVGFSVMYPGVPRDLECELDLKHDGPHIAHGFCWGMKDQSKDEHTQRMLLWRIRKPRRAPWRR